MIRLFEQWLLLPQRIALHEPSATAVVADVHLGYSASRQRLGDAVPCPTVEEVLHPLAVAASTYDIQKLVVAGDLFERGFDALIYEQFRKVLDNLRIGFLGLVPGNHDRGIEKAVHHLPLLVDGYDLAGWQICHGDQPLTNAPTVMGHWHPAIHLKRRKVPCFMSSGNRLLLPAFSLDAAGVDVRLDPRWRDWDCYVIDGNEVVQRNVNQSTRKQKTHGNRRGS